MMRMLMLLLIMLPLLMTFSPVMSLPSEVSVSRICWQGPTENTDGSALTDLSGYKIYWRQSSAESYDDVRAITVNDGSLGCYEIASMGLPSDGLYMQVVTAFNSAGAESMFSDEVNFTIRAGLPFKQTVEGMVPGAVQNIRLE